MTKRVPEFFFDTADPAAIKEIWSRLESDLPRTSVLGVTTNPNALDSVGIKTLVAMKARINVLAQLTTEIRGGAGGVINVQVPNSRMEKREMQDWVDYAVGLGDGQTNIAIKLPPNDCGLAIVRENRSVVTNITGVADSGTAVRCLGASPSYISLICGRIRDAGGNFEAELGWIEKNRRDSSVRTRVIGGSLRDRETVQNCIAYNGIPTIGAKAWKKMFEEGVTSQTFTGFWDADEPTLPSSLPEQNQKQRLISADFFEQMDKLGEPLKTEFSGRLHLRP